MASIGAASPSIRGRSSDTRPANSAERYILIRTQTPTLELLDPLTLLSSKDRAALRGEAHHLIATVHVGHQGLTDTLRQSLDDALRTRELVKLSFTRSASVDAKEGANELARQLGADVVQVIGRTATLYRQNPELERKDGQPPWR